MLTAVVTSRTKCGQEEDDGSGTDPLEQLALQWEHVRQYLRFSTWPTISNADAK